MYCTYKVIKQEGHDGPGSFPWVSCKVGLKGFYIIWPGDLVFNWVKVILAISVEDHPKIIPVKFVWYWTNSIVGDDV